MKIVECPRDAMQGLQTFVPTADKIRYLNSLLKVGFHTLDFGSFVSPKAIPQMRDTAEVLAGLDLSNTTTQLLAIIANTRGAEEASTHGNIRYLGFPLSISEEFQQRNTGKSIEEALNTVKEVQAICERTGKKQVVYLSMGFGNPYGEEYSPEILSEFVEKLQPIGIEIIALSDTIGCASPDLLKQVFSTLVPAYPSIEIGAHLHSNPYTSSAKIRAAIEAGCQRFDGALAGMGGCPMAKEELTGNIDTRVLLEESERASISMPKIDLLAFEEALAINRELFTNIH